MISTALLLLASVTTIANTTAPVDTTLAVRRDSTKAPADTSFTFTVGGFLDTYVAYDAGRPRPLDRAYTTQPARHNEFNVNLAFVELGLAGPRVRGRLALQAGTSVQSNYAGEPRVGGVSGPELGRLLQEAFVGYEVKPGLWIDGGVFYSNVGMEGWVSRDNPIYTRSLVADYSPYYSAGVRATWQATAKLTARVDLVNGWQIISENNEDKTLGARLDYSVTPTTSLSWYGLAGNEPGARLRLFNGVGLKTKVGTRVELVAQADVGSQEAADSAGIAAAESSTWYGAMLIGRVTLSPTVTLTSRVERYADKDQVLIATGTANGLRANGASLGFDVRPAARVLWRSEARVLAGDAAIFPDRDAAGGVSKRNLLVVTSLGLTF
jgi:Putative beta-barrel porin-2, OmpL-like. bbp2